MKPLVLDMSGNYYNCNFFITLPNLDMDGNCITPDSPKIEESKQVEHATQVSSIKPKEISTPIFSKISLFGRDSFFTNSKPLSQEEKETLKNSLIDGEYRKRFTTYGISKLAYRIEAFKSFQAQKLFKNPNKLKPISIKFQSRQAAAKKRPRICGRFLKKKSTQLVRSQKVKR